MRRQRANWNPILLFQRLILPVGALPNSSLCFIYSKRLHPLSLHREAWAQLSCCSECIWEKTLLSFLYIILPLSLDSTLGASLRLPRENCSDWLSLLCFGQWFPPFCNLLQNDSAFCSSPESLVLLWHPLLLFSSMAIFKIYLSCHFINVLGRKGKCWLYLINHIDPIFNQAWLRIAHLILHIRIICVLQNSSVRPKFRKFKSKLLEHQQFLF